ncbi:MAG: DUF3108 domain-containing protein [Gammaproteobacteria bacterium]|nr:DUF3108 domain-containing protein [Gammaproteobacteria bacterium]
MNGARWALHWFLPWALLLPSPAPGAQETSLRPFRAEYSLSRGYLEFARVEVELRLPANGGYSYRAHTIPIGLTAVLHSDEVTETSQGRIVDGQIQPLKYRYLHAKSTNPRQVELSFDWPDLRVTNTTQGTRWLMKIKPGTQDKFSQQLSLIVALANGKRNIQFPVADGGLTKQYSFYIQKEEIVSTGIGPLHTAKVIRSKNGRPSRASLWLAPELHYLPVKVERRENDGEYTMNLLQVHWD